MNQKKDLTCVIIDPAHLNPLLILMSWGTLGHIKAIHIMTQHFCEAHDSNSATPKLASVTKSETSTNAPRSQGACYPFYFNVIPSPLYFNVIPFILMLFPFSFNLLSSLLIFANLHSPLFIVLPFSLILYILLSHHLYKYIYIYIYSMSFKPRVKHNMGILS